MKFFTLRTVEQRTLPHRTFYLIKKKRQKILLSVDDILSTLMNRRLEQMPKKNFKSEKNVRKRRLNDSTSTTVSAVKYRDNFKPTKQKFP